MDLKAIEKSLLHLDEYPLEQWNPKLCEGVRFDIDKDANWFYNCLLYTSPSPRDVEESRMPSSA